MPGIWKITLPLVGEQLVLANTAWKAVELACCEARLYESGFAIKVDFVGWTSHIDTDQITPKYQLEAMLGRNS
jgi:hypothetical protein